MLGSRNPFNIVGWDRNPISKQGYVRWINIYQSSAGYLQFGGGYVDKEVADSHSRVAQSKRIACIRVEFEEGKGL